MVDKETKRKLRRIWCERLVISLCVPVVLNFSIAKVQSVYHEANLTWKAQRGQQARQQARQQTLQALQRAEQARQLEQALQRALQAQWQKLQQESLFLGISALCFTAMLLLLLRQRNQISLTLTGQFICIFPEECIAELEALHEQMKSEQRSNWLIHMIMLWTFLELFWAFYVQINIENLWLPQHRGRKNIDE